MTNPARAFQRRRALPALMLVGVLALFAAACGAPPSPAGWAPAVPIKTGNSELVLVTHKSHLYAMPDGSSNATWQFPPTDKNGYPVSEAAQRALNAEIDKLALADADKTSLKTKVADLHIAGPSIQALKDGLDASSAAVADRSRIKNAVDAITKLENGALGKIQAIYGDIGLSTDQKTAFVAGFKGFLFALDVSNGHMRWLRDDTKDGIVGGVAVDDGNLYYGTRGKHVFALDAATGGQKWFADTAGEVWATPALSADTLYVTSLDGSLYALDKTNGREKWRFAAAGSGIAAKPVVSGDAVYVGSFDNKLYSIKTSDGTMNWSVKADNWFWATPVVKDGTIYAASLDGKVYAVDAATGAGRWDKPFDAGSAIRSGPVIAGGGLVVASRNGKVNKLDLATGKAIDASPVVIANTKILADLATNGGNTVYVVPDSATLFTLDASNLGPPGSVPLPQ